MLPTDPAPTEQAPGLTYEQPPVPLIPRDAGARRGAPVLALAIGLVAVLAGGALFMSGFLVGQRFSDQPGTPGGRADIFQPFWDTFTTIESRYAGGEIDDQLLVRGAIRGMVEALGDPYSAYLTPEEYQTGLQDLSGQFEGIGAEIGTKSATGETSDCSTLGPECILIVVAPIDGSPAQKAGLLAGDAILAVDGAGLDGLTVDGARDKVRGKKGTEVVLTIKRGEDAAFDVAIVRDTIVQREVIEEDLAGGTIGHIWVTGFSDNAADQFHTPSRPTSRPGGRRSSSTSAAIPAATSRRPAGSPRSSSTAGPLFWEETADGKQEATDASAGGLATDGRRSSSSSSSTAAAHRRARSSRARSRIASARRSSARRRSARAPSSSGSSCRTPVP